MLEHSIVLLIITPLVGAYLIPLLGLWRERLSYPVAIAAVLLSAFFTFGLTGSVLTRGTIRYAVGGWPPPYGIELAADPLSAFMCLTISLISLLAVIYSKSYIEKELPGGKTTSYYTLLLLLIGGMLGAVVTGDLFNLFVLTEIFSISAYALVSIAERRGSFIASYRYLILAAIGTSLILLGTGYLYIITGTLNMADLALRLPTLDDPWVVFGAIAFFVVGFGIKTALFPLHAWLPNAYAVAPAPVSAIFSALVAKVGAYSLIRVLFTIFGVQLITGPIPVAAALTWVAAATILMGSLYAISQTDIKKMLAYSSVANTGYVLLGAGLAVELGMTGGILHILNHALATGCLFFCAGAVLYKTGIHRIEDFRGLGSKMPLTMAAFTLAAVSQVGIPPTAGFVSKFYLSLGALEAGEWIFIIVISLGSLMSALFYLRVIKLIYFGGDKLKEKAQMDELPPGMIIPIMILALGCVVLGIFVGLPLSMVESAVKLLLGM
ncbi:MAG TPA: monovalent cation/H+ antiporter subunit D family protein [Atribacteraceae bacterium]|nr:monovalent cation/H+ antiporter subunit D family protein [Atribacteraceae bacterium]